MIANVSTTPPSAFRNPDFTKLWTAATLSLLGTQVTQIAIPVIAVLLLHVTPFEVALLGTFEFLPFLLFTLPAGVWVDRLPRRRILISGDVGRALMLVTIPIAWELNLLTIWQLYAVGFVNGILTVFFDIADQSYLPTVLEREQLVDGNAKLQASFSTAQIVGQPIGGGLVAILTAPIAIVFDAISYVASALLVFSIRRTERASAGRQKAPDNIGVEQVLDSPSAEANVAAEVNAAARLGARETTEATVDDRPGIRREVAEGLRFVLGHRYLRSIAATTGTSNLFSQVMFATYPIFVYEILNLTPETVGLMGGAGGVGALLGAITANRIGARLGLGRTIVASIAINGPSALLVPIATHDLAVFLIGGSIFLTSFTSVVYNISQVSLRQAITPEPMLGRMNATMRFIVWGTIPIGQVIGGLIATAFTPLTAIWIGAIGGLIAFLPAFFSPVRTLRTIEEAQPAAA
jgi:MFS family permease